MKSVLIRMPEALWAHIKDEAEQHNRTFTAEAVHLLMDPRRRVYQELREGVKEHLRDLYGDNWVERAILADTKADREYVETADIDQEVEWMNPERSFYKVKAEMAVSSGHAGAMLGLWSSPR